LLARFFYLIDSADISSSGYPSARLVYAAVIAALAVIASLVLMPPLAYAFWCFPVDLFLFVAWLVAFCVLITVCIKLITIYYSYNSFGLFSLLKA
jgi:hypothetical protein